VKLHDLKPAPGSHKAKRRVGRGIAAGQGKTAGRGTKGQKARAGGNIPAWFEGGQTPLHQRLPKLRGFRNPFRVEYEIVNLGDVARLIELGVLEPGELPGVKPAKTGKAKAAASSAPVTVNQEILRAAGLVRTLDKPLKVLGAGELSTPLFVVADAFSASARAKIEAAGGSANVIEVTGRKTPSIGGRGGGSASIPAAEVPASPESPETPIVAEAPAPEADSQATPEASASAARTGEAVPEASPKPAARRRRAATPAVDESADESGGEAG
jgi:large subunit ribosomal protein L15